MESSKKIIIMCEDDVNHLYFPHLKADDIYLLKNRVSKNLSLIIGLEVNGEIKGCCILDFMSDTIHIRETTVKIFPYSPLLVAFAEGLAKFYKKAQVSTATTHKKVASMAIKLGFKKDEFGDYIKKVSYE